MHPLYNISTVFKNSFNIFGVDRSGKMRITVVLVRARRGRNFQELVANEKLDARHQLGLTVRRYRAGRQVIGREFGKVI